MNEPKDKIANINRIQQEDPRFPVRFSRYKDNTGVNPPAIASAMLKLVETQVNRLRVGNRLQKI